MDAPVLAALIAGAVALLVAGLSNFGAESYKRHRDATALAAGLAGELRGYLPAFDELAASLNVLLRHAAQGERVHVPRISRPTSPFFEGNATKLGVLGVDLVEQVSFVYSCLEGFRSLMLAATEENARASEQAAALAGAIDMLRRLRVAPEIVKRLQEFAHRDWLEPRIN